MWLNETRREDRKVSKCLMYFLLKTLRNEGIPSHYHFQFCLQEIKQLQSPRKPGEGGKGAQLTQHISFTSHLFLWGKLVLNYVTFELRGVFKDNPRLRWDRTSQQALLSLEVVSLLASQLAGASACHLRVPTECYRVTRNVQIRKNLQLLKIALKREKKMPM